MSMGLRAHRPGAVPVVFLLIRRSEIAQTEATAMQRDAPEPAPAD
jgi:hypothetical protein